jgi:hypothetical protein
MSKVDLTGLDEFVEKQDKSTNLDENTGVHMGGLDDLVTQQEAQDKNKGLKDKLKELEAFGVGSVQGNIPVLDELGGAIQTGMDVLGGGVTDTDANLAAQGFKGDLITSKGDLYRTAQQETQADINKLKEQNPKAYLTGELAGLALPGVGALSAETKLAKLLGSVGVKAAIKGGKKEITKELGRRALSGAATGAAGGAFYGALDSKSGGLLTPEEREKMLSDAESGAVSGAVLGGPIGLSAASAGVGLNLALDKFKNSDSRFVRQLKKSFDEGKLGNSFEGEANRKKLIDEETRVAQDVTDEIFGARKKIGDEIGELVDDATTNGVVLQNQEVIPTLQDVASELTNRPNALGGKAGTSDFFNSFVKLINGKLTPSEAYKQRKELNDVIANLDNNDDLKKVLINLKGQLDKTIEESVPGFKDKIQTFHDFSKAGPESLLAKGTPIQAGESKFISDKNSPKADFLGELQGVIEKSQKPGTSGDLKFKTFDQFAETLDKFSKEHPEVFERLGLDVSKIKSSVLNASDKSAIRQSISGHNPHGGGFLDQLASITSPRGNAYRVANYAGKVTPKLEDMTKAVYALPDEGVMKLANDLRNSGMQNIGDALERSLTDKGGVAKNAILFSILQNPNARKLIVVDQEQERK